MSRLDRRRPACSVLAWLLVMAGLTACSSDKSKESGQARENKPLRIAWSYWPGYSPLLVAQDRGFFTARGLALEPVEYNVSAKQMPDLEAGLLDGGLFAYADALTLAARHGDAYRLVLVCDNSNGADVIVARGDVATVADLAGKRIGAGMGSFGELLVRRMLAQNGLSVDDVSLVNMSAEAVPDALAQELIAAGQTWDPFAADAVSEGNRRLFSSAETPGLIPDVLLVRKEVLNRRPDDVRRFVAAWFDALAFMKEDAQAARQIIARMTKKDASAINLEGVRILSLDENIEAFTRPDSPISLVASAALNVDFMLSTGALAEPPDVQTLLDQSVLIAVRDAAGKAGK